MQYLNNILNTVGFKFLMVTGIFIGFLLTGLFIRGLLIRIAQRAVKKTGMRFDDIIFETIKGPSLLWVIIPAVYFTLQFFPDIPQRWEIIIDKGLLSLIIISVTWVLANGYRNFYLYMPARWPRPCPLPALLRIS